MKKIQLLLLLAIFLLALFLRFNRLDSIPVGLHLDEASLGYNAYSLLLTGKDEANHAFPLYIDMFGDNRPTGYNFLAVLPVKVFGLTEFATRFPGALFGALTVFAIFFLTFVLFENLAVALTASLLLALAPWHTVLSRASAEAIVALFFIILGFGFVFLSIQKKKIWYVPLGGLFLALSFFFYHTPRVFVPLLFFVYLIYFFWKLRTHVSKAHKKALLFTFVALSLVTVSLVFAVKGGTGRFTQVNIFSFPETKLVMEEQIREDGPAQTPIYQTRLFHNKPVNYSLTFISNYFSYFTGEFLFLKGGLPIWYNVPNMGLIYLVELPFLLYGIFLLLVNKHPFSKLPLLWLIVAPVVAAVTVDDVPNINRAIVLFPVIEIIAAYGFVIFIKRFSRKKIAWVAACFAVLLLYNFLYFQHQYTAHASVHRTWYRNNGFDKMVHTINESYNKVDKIIITKSLGGTYPLVLFYSRYDPASYQQEGSTKDKEYTGFGKYFFVPQGCPSVDRDDRFPRQGKYIYVDKGDCPVHKGLLLKKHEFILREDGTKAFRIVYD